MKDTKNRILDAAEQAFAENGYAATSLRGVISTAGVNLASIHYHFGSKEELLKAVILRRVEPLNHERLAMLAEFERAAGGAPVPLEQVAEAFIAPTVRMVAQPGGRMFPKLLARLYTESEMLPGFLRAQFGDLFASFSAALRRALPGLSEEELGRRLLLAIGVMAQGVRGLGAGEDIGRSQARIIAFLCAGLRAGGPQ
ncbi:MAG: TetR/AcrR family transcriptional regulator [Bryobacteraceae bacterium]